MKNYFKYEDGNLVSNPITQDNMKYLVQGYDPEIVPDGYIEYMPHDGNDYPLEEFQRLVWGDPMYIIVDGKATDNMVIEDLPEEEINAILSYRENQVNRAHTFVDEDLTNISGE